MVNGTYARASSSVLCAVTQVDPAMLETGSPGAAQALGRPATIRFYDPLLPRSGIVESRYSWRDVLSVAGRTGQADVGLLSGSDSAGALPVLGARAASLDGTLLLDPNGNLVLWARAGSPVRPLVLGPESEGAEPIGAAVRGKDELVLLAVGDACAARAVAVTAAGSSVLFEIGARPAHAPCPSNPDALALAPDGSLGVVRMPSGSRPPTVDDPALLLRAGQPPIALAPWSTLRPADDPACQGPDTGARALLMLPTAWIRLALPGAASTSAAEPSTLALVRWSGARVCLDAVEVAAGDMSVPETDLPTAVQARFTKPMEASRRGYGLGAEIAQPLTCRLVAP